MRRNRSTLAKAARLVGLTALELALMALIVAAVLAVWIPAIAWRGGR